MAGRDHRAARGADRRRSRCWPSSPSSACTPTTAPTWTPSSTAFRTDSDIAYAVIVDTRREPLAARHIAESLGTGEPPALAADVPLPAPGATTSTDVTIRGQRYVELIAPVGGTKTAMAMGLARGTADTAANGGGAVAADAVPVGYVRLGLTFDRQQQQFRKYLVGALSVVALLIALTIGATLLLTRGLVAPMRRLMRAARAVGAGKLDVYVPAQLERRARPAHPHVQPHDAAAVGVAGRGRRTTSARWRTRSRSARRSSRSRPRTRTSSRSTTS